MPHTTNDVSVGGTPKGMEKPLLAYRDMDYPVIWHLVFKHVLSCFLSLSRLDGASDQVESLSEATKWQ